MTSEQEQICDGVKALRREMRLSVHEFARAVGVADRTVQYWERHAHPPTGRRLARLRRLYEVWKDDHRWVKKVSKERCQSKSQEYSTR